MKEGHKRATIITVSSGKGGTGKTFFTVNFAVELKRRGYKVLILDADITLANVYLFLNIDEGTNFRVFLDGKSSTRDMIQTGVGGVDVIFGGGEIEDFFSLGEDEISRIIGGLNELEKSYDYIIIDAQAGVHDLNMKLMFHSDRNILITNPEITALVDLYKIIKIAAQKKQGIDFEIVINKAFNVEYALKLFKNISKTVNQFRVKTTLSFLGYITEDSRRVFESIQKRVPIVILHEMGNIGECFRMIADNFLKKEKPKLKVPFFYSLLSRALYLWM